MIYKLRLFSRDVVFEPLTLRASWMLQPNTLAPPTAQDLQPTRSLWVKQLGECIVNVASMQQYCGSGSVLDLYSEAFWIQIRILNMELDPDLQM